MTPPTGTPASPDPSIAALKRDVTEATEQLTEALKVYGEGARETRNAEYMLRLATRKLEATEYKAAERARTDAMTPSEVVDRILGR
jgi:hypothetical protein